jgi:hypothetical protein
MKTTKSPEKLKCQQMLVQLRREYYEALGPYPMSYDTYAIHRSGYLLTPDFLAKREALRAEEPKMTYEQYESHVDTFLNTIWKVDASYPDAVELLDCIAGTAADEHTDTRLDDEDYAKITEALDDRRYAVSMGDHRVIRTPSRSGRRSGRRSTAARPSARHN